MAAIFLAPRLSGKSWHNQANAAEIVREAIEAAKANGAIYADARVGICTLYGANEAFQELELLKTEILGMRICTENGWRHVLLLDSGKKALSVSIQKAIQAKSMAKKAEKHWLKAHFCQDEVLAQHSTDPKIEADLNVALLRFAEKQPLPDNTAQFHFCDFLIQH